LCKYHHRFDNLYLFGAFSPITGSHLLLEMPFCNTDSFQIFLNELSDMDKQEFKIMLLDNGAFHKAKRLQVPDNIALIFLPPYSPELNPAEKIWWVLKRNLKNRLFKTLQELSEAITDAVKQLIHIEAVKSITAYEYCTNAFRTTFNT
jgi:DDE superfamily endonuclease